MCDDEGTREILDFIERYGIARKDGTGHRKPQKKRGSPRKSRTVRETLDLHGLYSDEAARRLRSAIYRCRENGVAELLIIHGYGRHSNPSEGPVLRKLVLDMLDSELLPLYRYYKAASFKDGGDGATLLLFR